MASSVRGRPRAVRGRRSGCRLFRSFVLGVGLFLCAPLGWAQSSLERPSGIAPGDASRGRALVADRQQGLCLLCHTAPIAEVRQQGNLAPPLDGAGARLSESELRLRLVDSRRVNPESLMPAYGVADPAPQVGVAWRGKPIFTAQQIEDVVAWLATLK